MEEYSTHDKMEHRSRFSCIVFMVILAVASMASGVSVKLGQKSRSTCVFYDQTECEKNDINCVREERECETGEDTCMAFWKNDTSGFELIHQRCWKGKDQCNIGTHCITHKAEEDSHFFCCCYGDLCNENVSYIPLPTLEPVTSNDLPRSTPFPVEYNYDILFTVVYSLVPITVFTLVVLIVYWMCRRHNYATLVSIHTTEPSPLTTPLTPSSTDSVPLQLIEVKARGRFGCVWKAQSLNEFVAVKIFPLQDKQSWMREQEIYSLPGMQHDCLLSFIGTEKKYEGISQEFWLITEYHPRGSLYDYLKANLISFHNLCHIAESLARGLAFLHDPHGLKPPIAHRDFKSKNVLLKNNLTACIADFGLAVKFDAGTNLGENHGQVGTRRYMAPEVLEGAIQFTQNAFLRLDMYACGLVLWELVSRCSAQDGPVDEYMLPFEEEVGQAPTLEDMQDCVVHRRQRPILRETWLKHQGLGSFCDTIEECWDHEAEARLTAGCVQERISQLIRTSNQMNTLDMNNANSTNRSPLITDLSNGSTVRESSF